jgi:hypothetical protein
LIGEQNKGRIYVILALPSEFSLLFHPDISSPRQATMATDNKRKKMLSNELLELLLKFHEHDTLRHMMTMNLNSSSLCSTSAKLTHECELFQQLVPGQFRIQLPDLDDSSHQKPLTREVWSLLPTTTVLEVSESVHSWMPCWRCIERQRCSSSNDGKVEKQSSRNSFI